MGHDPDFELMLRAGAVLVNLRILYSLPDHPALVNEFFWQTADVAPSFPRIGRFLDFWRREIEGEIREVTYTRSGSLWTPDWRSPRFLPV